MEQKAEVNAKRRERRTVLKKEQSVDQIFYDRREKERSRKAAYRKSLTADQKAEINKKRRENRKKKLSTLSNEERKAINKK